MPRGMNVSTGRWLLVTKWITWNMPAPGSQCFTLGWQTHADNADFTVILPLLIIQELLVFFHTSSSYREIKKSHFTVLGIW